LKVQLYHIGQAMRSVVPPEMWGDIVQKLEEFEQHSEALVGGTYAYDDDEPYNPLEFFDDDDEL
jgi:hypothetical protein